MKNDINKILLKKYPHLEISVIKLSEAQTDNETCRIDSEYFKQAYLNNEKILKNLSIGCEKLENLIHKMTGGATPLGANYPESGIPFLRVQNIMQNYFNLNDIVYISSEDDKLLKRSKLKINDVILTITGAYGKSAVVYKDLVGANINQHSVKIEVKNVNPYFLSTFINSKFGQLQCDKKITGVTRPALDYRAIKNFLIPMFSKEFQLEIETMVKDSHKALENSKKLYKEAEDILYGALGLNSENPLESILLFGKEKSVHSLKLDGKNDNDYIVASPNYLSKYKGLNISIRTYKESYLKTGRLDAEYYQIKYDLIENAIKSYYGGWNIISSYFEQNKTNSNFDKSQYNYIEISDINISYGTASYNLIEVDNLPANAKISVNKNDILVSKVRPYRGAVAIIDFEEENVIASGAFTVLKEKIGLKKEVLKVLLKSVIYKELLLKYNVGTSYPVIKDEDILNLPIPSLNSKTQEKIEDKIKQSFDLLNRSKELLESAKMKIEEAIELWK